MATAYFSSARASAASSITAVQCGQRVAAMSISLMQKGHFFVGVAASVSYYFIFGRVMSLLKALTIAKMIIAIMRKLITAAIKLPNPIGPTFNA